MKILCINPNGSPEVTKGIEETCKEYVLPDTEITVKSIKEVPPGIVSYHDAAVSEKVFIR